MAAHEGHAWEPTDIPKEQKNDLGALLETCKIFFEPSHEASIEEQEFALTTEILAVFHSNNIEHNPTSFGDTTRIIKAFAIGKDLKVDCTDPSRQKARTEVVQHFQALQAARSAGKEKRSLSQVLLQEWHTILMKGLLEDSETGHYRKEGCFAGQRVFVSHGQIPGLMENLIKLWDLKKEDANYSAFALAGYFSYALVSIHPFTDGNGRLCRILANYILSYFGFRYAVPISSNRASYIKALRYADRDYEGPTRTGVLAALILKDAHHIVSSYLSNERLRKELDAATLKSESSSS